MVLEVRPSMIQGREYAEVTPRLILAREVGEQYFTPFYQNQRIPNLEVDENDKGGWYIVVDGRIASHVTVATPEDLESLLYIMATAMAVAAGFTCFGEGSQPINIYRKVSLD